MTDKELKAPAHVVLEALIESLPGEICMEPSNPDARRLRIFEAAIIDDGSYRSAVVNVSGHDYRISIGSA